MLGPRRLDDSKMFGCLTDNCSDGVIHVSKGTPEGSIVFHSCGTEAVLTYDGRSWSLRAKDEAQIIENRGDKNMAEVEEIVPKKKRGRPKKVQAVVEAQVASDEQRERDVNLMKGVEADCPHEVASPEGQEWCAQEFDKRKANVAVQVNGQATVEAPKKRGRKKKEETALVKAEPQFDKDFVSEAKQSDKRIDKALVRGGESFFEAIRELIGSGEKGYYKALGFKTFDAYRTSKTEYSRSHIGQGIQVYKALHGKIADDKFMALPMPTAVLLTKIPESKLTEELIDEVSDMTIQEFKEKKFPELSGQLVDATTGKPLPVPQEEYSWVPRIRAHSQVVDRWKNLMEMAKWHAAGLTDENDVFSNFDINEKALLAICAECSSSWEVEYQSFLEQQKQAVDDPAF